MRQANNIGNEEQRRVLLLDFIRYFSPWDTQELQQSPPCLPCPVLLPAGSILGSSGAAVGAWGETAGIWEPGVQGWGCAHTQSPGAV